MRRQVSRPGRSIDAAVTAVPENLGSGAVGTQSTASSQGANQAGRRQGSPQTCAPLSLPRGGHAQDTHARESGRRHLNPQPHTHRQARVRLRCGVTPTASRSSTVSTLEVCDWIPDSRPVVRRHGVTIA
jgi:hypothetical protein